MKVAGIIAEYNPFHNGHAYQLQKLKEQTGADYCIIAMSGDFLQRGVPALVDKYTRAKMALMGGADLVLELPTLWATASAEYFASAGVALLGETGVVNVLGYGVEKDHPALMQALTQTLSESPIALTEEILAYQKQGDNYPTARSKSLCALLPQFEVQEIEDFLATPNNILALEYEKALHAWAKETDISISSCPISRIGGGYHDTDLSTDYASATAIRKQLLSQSATALQTITPYVPQTTLALLQEAQMDKLLLEENVISEMLLYKLLSLRSVGYQTFADCSEDLSNKILKSLTEYKSFTQFCDLLKSKDLTYSRISRVLLHILLDIQKDQYEIGRAHSYNAYLRVLGFRSDASELLSAIKKNSSVPMITKVADASSILTPDAFPLLEKDLYAAAIYRSLASMRTTKSLRTEYTQEFLRV